MLFACSPSTPPTSGATGKTGSADANGSRRTSWGEPNLEGTYTNKDEFGLAEIGNLSLHSLQVKGDGAAATVPVRYSIALVSGSDG